MCFVHKLTRKTILELAELAVGVYLAIKYALWVILQCFYEQFKHNQDYKYETDKVQDWLTASGSLYRSLAGLGVFLNIIFNSITLCFYFPNIFSSRPRRFRAVRKSLPRDIDIQREKVYKCLVRMIGSSEVHAKERGSFAAGSVLAKMNVHRLAHAARLHNPKLSPIQENNLHLASYEPRLEPFSLYHIHSSNRKSSVSSLSGRNNSKFTAWNIVASLMVAEHGRLIRLLAAVNCFAAKSVPPKTIENKQIWIQLYLFFLIYFGFCVFVSHILAMQSLPSPISTIEKLTMVEQYLMVLYGLNNFIPPLVDIVGGFKARMKYLVEVEERLRAHLKLSAIGSTLTVSPLGADMISSIYTSESLEIYLTLIMFASDVGTLFEQSRSFIYRCMSCVLYCLIPTLLFLDSERTSHVSFFATSIVSILVALNTTFLFCSFFSASCLKVTRMAWPLIAISVQNQVSLTKCLDEVEQVRGGPFMLMSPHSLMLWRRFIGDREKLIDRYTCRLLGSLRLDYTSVIRVNLWLVSLVILFTSSRLR